MKNSLTMFNLHNFQNNFAKIQDFSSAHKKGKSCQHWQISKDSCENHEMIKHQIIGKEYVSSRYYRRKAKLCDFID